MIMSVLVPDPRMVYEGPKASATNGKMPADLAGMFQDVRKRVTPGKKFLQQNIYKKKKNIVQTHKMKNKW